MARAIRGWPRSAVGPEHSWAIHGSTGGLGPWLAPNNLGSDSRLTTEGVSIFP